MPSDENAPLLEGLLRPGAARRPAKSSKQRGSILSNVHPNRVTVFGEHETPKPGGRDTQLEGEKIRDDRVQNLETAIKVLQKKGERTAIDQKALDDRLSTIEANFVELKCEMMLFPKPSPSTPAKSRPTYDLSTDSPIICPSLTGAEENTSFSSPPVPALQRKLLRMSMQGREPSRLRGELYFDDFEKASTRSGDDSVEYLTEDQSSGGVAGWEDLSPNSLESVVFNKKSRNPPPTYNPDLSFGDVSMIDGIYDDAARAGAYLDSQQTGTSDITSGTPPEVVGDHNNLEEPAVQASQTECAALINEAAGIKSIEIPYIMIDASIQTDRALDVSCNAIRTSAMMDGTVQTETSIIATCDAAVQVNQSAPSMRDAALQTTQEDPTVQFQLQANVEDLSARIKQVERLVAVQNRSPSSAEHQALVVAYKALLRVEAEKRLDLVAMISSFKNELASCQMEQPQKTVYGISVIWRDVLSHLVIVCVTCAVLGAIYTR